MYAICIGWLKEYQYIKLKTQLCDSKWRSNFSTAMQDPFTVIEILFEYFF